LLPSSAALRGAVRPAAGRAFRGGAEKNG